MKKNLILASLFCFILNISCSPNNENESEASNLKIQEVLKEANFSAQKIMYGMLNSEEKHKIWIDKIDNLLSSSKLNNEQIDLILELKNNVNLQLFESSKNNSLKNSFKDYMENEFARKAIKLFDQDFLYESFCTLNGTKYSDSSKATEKPDCVCTTESAVTCNWGTDDCMKTTKCKETTDGCGWLFQYECDGRCY